MFNIIKRKITTVGKNPKLILIKILLKVSPLFKDRTYLKLLFPLYTGYKLDLENPKTYNEKLQWLKLNFKKPLLSKLVDKYEAKLYTEKKIGKRHVIHNFGVWESFEDIDFDQLPKSFVLKTTHDQGGVVICKDKDRLNFGKVKKKFNRHLNNKQFYLTREWPYKEVRPRIIAEELIEETNREELKDYKFFCFDGEPKLFFIAEGRQSKKLNFSFYDIDFNPLDIKQIYKKGSRCHKKPDNFVEMVKIARELSQGLPHVRIDLYNTGDRILFGEYTFFHHKGMTPFSPADWDLKLGELINLPKIKHIQT